MLSERLGKLSGVLPLTSGQSLVSPRALQISFMKMSFVPCILTSTSYWMRLNITECRSLARSTLGEPTALQKYKDIRWCQYQNMCNTEEKFLFVTLCVPIQPSLQMQQSSWKIFMQISQSCRSQRRCMRVWMVFGLMGTEGRNPKWSMIKPSIGIVLYSSNWAQIYIRQTIQATPQFKEHTNWVL